MLYIDSDQAIFWCECESILSDDCECSLL